jgi:hypothetical protein
MKGPTTLQHVSRACAWLAAPHHGSEPSRRSSPELFASEGGWLGVRDEFRNLALPRGVMPTKTHLPKPVIL